MEATFFLVVVAAGVTESFGATLALLIGVLIAIELLLSGRIFFTDWFPLLFACLLVTSPNTLRLKCLYQMCIVYVLWRRDVAIII